MLNLKKNLYIAGAFALCALAACSSDNPSSAGSTTMPNATAENSSSSEEVASSSSVNSFVPGKDIVFTTAATSVKKIAQGEVTVYGNENGAEASCSAGKYASTKKYLARISIADGETMERTIGLYNFGSACNDIYKAFQESCNSGLVDVAPDAVCSGNGDLKAFCYASKTDSVTTCNARGECVTAGPDSTINFDTLLESFTKESNDICGTIADGGDTTEYDIPKSEPDSSIKANSGRVFILEPNTTNLEVSDEERVTLDSLAEAFPQKTRIDEIDGMTIFINYDAEYNFTTEGKKFFREGSCNGAIFEEEFGIKRHNYFSNPFGFITATTILYDKAIVYLARGENTQDARDIFIAECEAANGSLYDYRPDGVVLAVACAVKNFTETPFSTIVSEQANFCDIIHTKFEQPIQDPIDLDTTIVFDSNQQ